MADINLHLNLVFGSSFEWSASLSVEDSNKGQKKLTQPQKPFYFS